MRNLVAALVALAGVAPAQVVFEEVALPEVVTEVLLPESRSECGFAQAHAPASYTPQELTDALAAVPPGENATLVERSERQFVDDRVVSVRTETDTEGALLGSDFAGDLFDPSTWFVTGPGLVPVEVRSELTRERRSRDVVFREYVIPNGPGGGSNVNVAVWSLREPTDLVDNSSATLRYTPNTVPSFIPQDLVADALAGQPPGAIVPLATGFEVHQLAVDFGALLSNTVEAYNAAFGVDYIGDPGNYQTWIAIGPNDVQVNVTLVTEEGMRFLDQVLDYELVVPDATGEVILNPLVGRVTEVTDTERTWDKTYTLAGAAPPGVDPGDAATLAGKLATGTVGHALQVAVEDVTARESTVATTFDGNGAVPGVDFAGDPSDPTTWTALTAADVVVDRFDHHTVTVSRTASHELRMIYREASDDPGTTGQLFLIENDVVGRDIVEVTRRFRNEALDVMDLPEGVSEDAVEQALRWSFPGEAVVVAQERERILVSDESSPLAPYLDTNGNQHGVDYLGDPGDPGTWTAAGAADVYIDRYHPVERRRRFDETVINYVLTAPAGAGQSPQLAVETLDNGMAVYWSPPFGSEWAVASGPGPQILVPGARTFKAVGLPLRHTVYRSAATPSRYLRAVPR